MNDYDSPTPLDQDSCFICERELGTIELLCGDKPVLVCPACYEHETDEDCDDEEAA